MKLASLNCPNCQANLTIDTDGRQAYCQYCGARLFVDDGTTHSYEEKVFTDVARLREIELKERQEEEKRQIRLQERADKRTRTKWFFLIHGAIFVVSFIGCGTYFSDRYPDPNYFQIFSVLIAPIWLVVLLVGLHRRLRVGSDENGRQTPQSEHQDASGK